MKEICGHFVYKHLAISQVPNIQTFFEYVLTKIEPKRILEIGTFAGGLTLMLRDILDKLNLAEATITTYDIHDQSLLKAVIENSKIEVKTENLFCNNYKEFKNEDIKNNMTKLVQQDGTTLVLCDGGNKISEFKAFSELLKKGDVIMVHDYSPSVEYFEANIKNKIWNWHEISYSDIQDSCSQHKLVPLFEDLSFSSVWGCFVKQ